MHLHKYIVRLIFLVCFVFANLIAFSQVKYSNDSSYISTLSNLDKTNQGVFHYSKVDSTINNFQNYFPRNTNGNYGLSSAPLYINYQAKALGFNLYQAPYDNDMINADNVQYYKTKGPLASLTGIAGSKQEQAFKLLFSNSFKNKLNITLAFNRYGGLGFYNRQLSFTNNLYITSNYTSKNSRVGYYAYFLFNKVKHQENGGIKNDSLFLDDVNVNKNLIPIRLSNAKREVRYSSLDFNPWFRLNKIEDSSTVLSHFIDYNINYSGNFSKYIDNGDTIDKFYNISYLDTVATLDSTHWRTITNGLNYTLKINPLDAKLQLGFKNEINQVYQHMDSAFMNNSVNAGFFINDENYNGFAKVNYIVNGSNQNDYSVEINNRYAKNIFYSLFKSPFVANFNVQFEKRHPDFIFNTWYSNHFQWSNQFAPTEKIQSTLSIGTQDERFKLGVVSQTIKNFLYFNEMARPEQTPLTINNLAVFAKKDFLLFKHLGINLGYTYQSSSYEAIVSVPNHIANGALYYQGNLFKKALQIQIGFNAQYFSEFYGYAYMPATNLYYVQTQKTVGNYPFIDFFLTARIKPVRFFIKIDHVTQGMLGNNYALIPGYLQNDRAFKFGLNWLFFD